VHHVAQITNDLQDTVRLQQKKQCNYFRIIRIRKKTISHEDTEKNKMRVELWTEMLDL